MHVARTAGPRADPTAFVVPRPFVAGAPFVIPGLLAFLAGLTPFVSGLYADIFAACLAVFGVGRTWMAHHELVRLRREADRQLRRGSGLAFASPLTRWRASELTAHSHRLALARAVVRIERDLSTARLPGAVPLNRVAARGDADLLEQLARELRSFEDPVTPLAMLHVDDLLTRPDSPLYERERADDLRPALLASLSELDEAAELQPVAGVRL